MNEDTTEYLGAQVRDEISGFEGIVVSVANHITGCDRIGVRPVERADRGEEEWFYPEQLEIVTQDTEFWEFGDHAQTDVEFELGDELEDNITGVSGYVGTITYNLFNCPRVAIQPIDNTDSKESPDREWFDAPRMSRVGEGISDEFEDLVNNQTTSATGAPDTDIHRKSDQE